MANSFAMVAAKYIIQKKTLDGQSMCHYIIVLCIDSAMKFKFKEDTVNHTILNNTKN